MLDVYDVRIALEGFAAARAAERIADEDVALLDEMLKRAEGAIDDDPLIAIEVDRLLHEVVTRSCGNPRLDQIVGGLRDQVHLFRIIEGYKPDVVRCVMRKLLPQPMNTTSLWCLRVCVTSVINCYIPCIQVK